MKPTVRALSPPELAVLIDWAAAEGWNPGLDDAAAFRPTDPEGFIGAFVDNEMTAAISAVAYGGNFGFIGLYICRPDMRGKGHGKAVWNAGMARLAAERSASTGSPRSWRIIAARDSARRTKPSASAAVSRPRPSEAKGCA
ncbi:GNAT family N-acetyltransferase [Mesorhizobium sp. RSR380A]|uniref:GNAT family N-acetyltransferase n=1 Tax=Mesorhizobium sp. LNJC380A00 TaxID=1287264 RepID=UPI000408E4FB